MTERFTLVDADTLMYRATIDDPKVYTKPWTIEFPFKRDAGPACSNMRATKAITRSRGSFAARGRRNAADSLPSSVRL